MPRIRAYGHVTIPPAAPVSPVSVDGEVILVVPSQGGNTGGGPAPSIGFTSSSIDFTTDGELAGPGQVVDGANTDDFDDGQALYLGYDPGSLDNHPTSENAQQVAICLLAAAPGSGRILVQLGPMTP